MKYAKYPARDRHSTVLYLHTARTPHGVHETSLIPESRPGQMRCYPLTMEHQNSAFSRQHNRDVWLLGRRTGCFQSEVTGKLGKGEGGKLRNPA